MAVGGYNFLGFPDYFLHGLDDGGYFYDFFHYFLDVLIHAHYLRDDSLDFDKFGHLH